MITKGTAYWVQDGDNQIPMASLADAQKHELIALMPKDWSVSGSNQIHVSNWMLERAAEIISILTGKPAEKSDASKSTCKAGRERHRWGGGLVCLECGAKRAKARASHQPESPIHE